MEILEFIFRSLWHFAGSAFLIYCVGNCIAMVVRAARKGQP